MKKELIEKKKQLENQLIKINEEINLQILRDDLEELQIITDQLTSLFYNKIVKKYGEGYLKDNHNASVSINRAIGVLDEASVKLEEEISEIENELNSETE